MASSWTLYGIVLIVSAFAIGGNARPGPCKILYISSFTITSSINFQNPNPNPNPNQIDNSPRTFFTIFDIYPAQQQQQPIEIFLERRPSFDSRFVYRRTAPNHLSLNPDEETIHLNHQRKSDSDSFGVSSLRERTKDILSVVAALLFGVGCGALTSATMYLAWSLITNNSGHGDGDGDYVDFTTDDDDDVSPKKMGYQNIPDDVVTKSAPAPKEVV